MDVLEGLLLDVGLVRRLRCMTVIALSFCFVIFRRRHITLESIILFDSDSEFENRYYHC